MTYKIWYKEHKMFDIDIYIACTEKDENGERKYYTKVVPSLVAEGMGYYIIENIETPEQLEEFLQWVNIIDDFSLTLFEGYPSMDENWENSPIDCHDADIRMCRIHLPVFKSDMKAFCNKFGLSISLNNRYKTKKQIAKELKKHRETITRAIKLYENDN